jgi:hypothetical protein
MNRKGRKVQQCGWINFESEMLVKIGYIYAN